MTDKPVILTFVRHYLPGYKSGGPTRTIANMVAALGEELDFRIVTSDRDATDTRPYPDITETWMEVGNAKVLYLPPARRALRQIAWILRKTPHNVLYLNSFFDADFTLKPLVARRARLAPQARCVIAPRGELSPAALKLKAWKKRPFLLAAPMSGLYHGLTWQASSAHEEADIRRAMGGTARDIRVAIDLPTIATPKTAGPHRPRSPDEPLNVCFVARISPMKNLDFALEVLRQVQTPVRFDIYGPVRDEGYWSRCQSLMSRLPGSVAATYRGSVERAEVPSVLARYDLFFLPTLGENYGHAILEALTVGTPVLIADTTPWRDLAKIGVGWDLPLARPEAFAQKIDQVARLTPAEQAHMRLRAASFAESHRKDCTALKANHSLFTRAL